MMLFNWLNTREATEVGSALADDFVLQSASASPSSKEAKPGTKDRELQKFLQRFLQRVDRDARPLELNVFKRAKLANSFKWRLLEKGVEREIVDELTQALVLRLTVNQGSATRADGAVTGSTGRSGRNVPALLLRGGEYQARGAYAEAAECYQEVLSFDPRNAVARNELGIAFAQLSRYKEAEDELRRAIGIRASFPEAHYNLGGVLQSTGRFRESETPLRRALRLKPAYVDSRVSLGATLVFLGRLQEAKECYEMALRSAPRNTKALVGMGQIEALNGNFAGAEPAYRNALEVDPSASYAWAALVWLRKMKPTDGAWLKRAEEFAANGLNPIEECTLRFAMGKYCDDVGDFPRAFGNYQRANELQKLRAQPYDAKARTRFVDDLIRVYTPEALSAALMGASESERPLFVVGMPRSGTSLVEQIIASHPAAHGAGELEFWTDVMRKHEIAIRQGLPADSLRRKLALDYLRILAGHSASAMRVVDKAPINADYLGLIHSIFPQARVIYMSRDPIDTCLSCYFQQFSPTTSYAMDLSDLVHYYREHQRLVEHWRRALPPDKLLVVPYADLTSDQERWTRTILDFVGLPWNERCLEFHKTERTVVTASLWQVRQKMYKSSVGRWRNYEKFIGPLLKLKGVD